MGGWIVAASVGAVEALKDQGICRWNYPLRQLHRRAKTNALRSFSGQPKWVSSNTTATSSSPTSESDIVSREFRDERAKRTEETLRKVMQLSSWGPN